MDALFDFLKIVPFWVGPLIAGVVYLVGQFLIPAVSANPGKPINDMIVNIAHVVAPWLAVLVLVLWIFAEIAKLGNRRLFDTRSDAASLRGLSWQEFETLIGEAFRRQGYTVSKTPAGPDGGVDLVLTKGGEQTFVQCKQWKSWKVGAETIRALYGVVAKHGAVGGIVVCSGRYTPAARKFAQGVPIQLIDGPALQRMIDDVKRNAGQIGVRQQPIRPKPSSSPTQPLCPQCQSPMVLRTAKQGAHAGSRFYGCSNFPACRGIRPYQAVP